MYLVRSIVPVLYLVYRPVWPSYAIFKAQYGYLISDVRCTVQCVVRNRLKSHGSRLASVIIYMVHFGRPRPYTRALFDCCIPDVGPRMAVITDERHIVAVSYLV